MAALRDVVLEVLESDGAPQPLAEIAARARGRVSRALSAEGDSFDDLVELVLRYCVEDGLVLRSVDSTTGESKYVPRYQ